MSKILFAAAVAASAICAPAQTLQAGWTSSLTQLPNAVEAVYDLPGPGVVYYDGSALVLDHGASTRALLTFASPPAFASFTIPVGQGAVLFGESDRGEVWFVPLDENSSPHRVATIRFNYDAVALNATTVLVSAKTGGFAAPDNDVLALDLTTGAIDPIAVIPGFSGPIAIDAAGDLYYATATLSTSDVLRFTAAQVASARGPSVLTAAHAAIVFAGLPSASDLAVDDDGDLFVTDFIGPSLLEVSLDPVAPPRLSTLMTYPAGAPAASALSYTSAPGAEAFEPFQPAFGKMLTVVETQFGGAARIRTIRANRATLGVPPGAVPVGTFSIHAAGGPAGALGAVLIGTQFGFTPFALPGVEQPALFEVELGALVASADLTLGTTGAATLPLYNGGFSPAVDFAVQLVFIGTGSGGETIVGTTAGEVLTLSL